MHTLIQVENAKPQLFVHWLANQIISNYFIDPANGVELIERLRLTSDFSGNIVIKEKNKALEEAKKYQIGNIIQTNRSKFGKGNIMTMVNWKDKDLNM